MTNVVATPPPPSFIATGTAATAIAILDANPALAGLDPGSLIEGVVVGQDARGQTIIETEYGQVALTARINLPVGASVVLQLQGAGSRLSAIILSVDGQPVGTLTRTPVPPLPSPAALVTNPPASAPQPATLARATIEVTLSTDAVFTATVLWTNRAASALPALPTQGSPASAGDPATVPTSTPAPAGETSTPPPISAAPPAGTRAAAAAPVPAIFGAQAPQEGSQFAVRVLAIQPPGAPITTPSSSSPAPPSSPPPPSVPPIGDNAAPAPTLSTAVLGAQAPAASTDRQLAGIVAARGASGQVEIRTPVGVIELPLPSEPPSGSHILLELLGPPTLSPAPSQPSVGFQTASPIELARAWPTLRAALETLAKATPATIEAEPVPATEVARGGAPAVPRPGPQLGLALLAFATALEDGKPENWLGSGTLPTLESRGPAGLATHLATDFGQLGALANERGVGDWRSFFIPIQHNGALDQLRLFVRRRNPQRGSDAQRRGGLPGKSEPSSRRFVIELELSHLGPLQLDGFLKGKRLSLILRGKRALAPELRAVLVSIFDDANALAGLTGTLSFEDRLPQFPLAPIEALRGKAEAVTV